MRRSIGQRLPAADTEMLAVERLGPHVSGGCPWLWVLDGPCPSVKELVEHLRPRLPHRMSQRVRETPLRVTRPLWVDTPGWSLEDHVSLVEDPRYWSREGWLEFVSERLEIRMDRSRPLWRMWLIPHLDQSSFALVSLFHHALTDGHSGIQLLLLLSSDPLEGERTEGERTEGGVRGAKTPLHPARGEARRERVALAVRDVRDGLAVTRAAARGLVRSARAPRERWAAAQETCGALAELALDLRSDAPSIPQLNMEHGARQRVGHFDMSAGEVLSVLGALECFPNDLFLSLVGAGVARLLAERGLATEALEIQTWVPVNIGEPNARAELGNHFSGFRVAVPAGPMAAVERLRRVRMNSRRASTSRLPQAGRLVTKLENAFPAPTLHWAAQIALSPRTMNLITSHMVLPPALTPLPGRRLLDAHVWTFLPPRHTMSFVARSLASGLSVNYIVDPGSVPDFEHVIRGMEDHARELVETATTFKAAAQAEPARSG